MFHVLKKKENERRTSSPPRLLLTAETSSGGGTRDGRADFVLGWLQPCRDQRLPRLSCKEESALFSPHSDQLKAASELSSLNLTFCFPHTILLSATESSNLRKHTKSPKKSTDPNSALWQRAPGDGQKLSLAKAERTVNRYCQIKASESADGLMWSTSRCR